MYDFFFYLSFQESKIPNITALPTYRKMRGMSSSMGKPVSRHNLPLLELGLGSSSSSSSSSSSASSSASVLAALASSLKNSNNNNNKNSNNTASKRSSGDVISNTNYNHQQIPPVSEFTCECVPGWTGPTCEISKLNI